MKKPLQLVSAVILLTFNQSFGQVYTDEVQVIEGLGGKVGVRMVPQTANFEVLLTGSETAGRKLLANGTGLRLQRFGDSGGVQMRYGFLSHDGLSDFGGFGGYVNASGFNYFFVGEDYQNPIVTFLPDGKVGIGLNQPDARLHLGGQDAVLKGRSSSAAIKLHNTAYAESIIGYGFFEHDAYGDVLLGATRSDYPVGLGFLRFYAGGNEKMVLSGDGKLGIGTPNPEETLDVRGNLLLENGGSPIIYTGVGSSELNRYVQLINATGSMTASGLKAGGLLVSDTYSYANPNKNDLIVKGNIGIGTNNPQGRLQVGDGLVFGGTGSTHLNLPYDAFSLLYGSGSGTSFVKTAGAGNYTILHEINSTGYHISQNASSRDIRVISYSGGVKLVSGATSWASVSDIRLKDNIEPVSNALNRIMDWRSITYTLKDDPSETASRRVGVVAQDIIKSRPEAVSQGDDGYYSVRYTELIPDLISAIQELKMENEQLKIRISNLENN